MCGQWWGMSRRVPPTRHISDIREPKDTSEDGKTSCEQRAELVTGLVTDLVGGRQGVVKRPSSITVLAQSRGKKK